MYVCMYIYIYIYIYLYTYTHTWTCTHVSHAAPLAEEAAQRPGEPSGCLRDAQQLFGRFANVYIYIYMYTIMYILYTIMYIMYNHDERNTRRIRNLMPVCACAFITRRIRNLSLISSTRLRMPGHETRGSSPRTSHVQSSSALVKVSLFLSFSLSLSFSL